MNPKVFFHSNIPSLIGEMKQRKEETESNPEPHPDRCHLLPCPA